MERSEPEVLHITLDDTRYFSINDASNGVMHKQVNHHGYLACERIEQLQINKVLHKPEHGCMSTP